jgi:hypothetical protein
MEYEIVTGQSPYDRICFNWINNWCFGESIAEICNSIMDYQNKIGYANDIIVSFSHLSGIEMTVDPNNKYIG